MFKSIVAAVALGVGMMGGQASAQAWKPRADLSTISAYKVQSLAVPADPGAPFEVALTVEGREIRVALEPRSVRADGFQAYEDRGDGQLAPVEVGAPTTYRGLALDVPGSRAAMSIVDGGLAGMICLPDEAGADQWWCVEPMSWYRRNAQPGAHVVYHTSALPELPGFCGVGPEHGVPLHAHKPGGGQGGPDGIVVCQLAMDMDFEYYQLVGSSTPAVNADVELIINNCNVIYERDVAVTFEVVTTIIRSNSSDPYNTASGQTLLDQMRSHWISAQGGVQRDLAHLFSGRDFTGSTVGVAYLNGVCSTDIGYGVVQVPGLSLPFRVAVSCHEMGHNFSAAHCDGNPTCSIMCSGLGGCTGNITSFGASEISQITGFASVVGCLSPQLPPSQPLPFFDDFPTNVLDPIKWRVINGATSNRLSINPVSPEFAMLLTNTANVTSIDVVIPTTLFPTPVFVSFWTEHRFVEAGESLKFEYFSTIFNGYRPITTVVSTGVDQTRYVPHELKLPVDAYGARFKLRITAQSNDPVDFWYVDDVSVSLRCLTDLNQDGALDIFDFLDFQNLYAARANRGDWNRDGFFDIFDFLEFQNSFAAGCY